MNPRIFPGPEGWFLRTREGLRGPFGSKAAAEKEAVAYAETMEFLERHGDAMAAGYDFGEVEIVNMNGPCWG